MLKLYVVIRVYILMYKGWRIAAIKLVRKHLGYGDKICDFRRAKRFVEEVHQFTWPENY